MIDAREEIYAKYFVVLPTLQCISKSNNSRPIYTSIHWFWRSLLPGFALVGGLMLFRHMHGLHPGGHDIQTHHNIMGTLALAGGLAWFAGELLPRAQISSSISSPLGSLLKILWSIFILIIGIQLLFYSES